MIDSRENAPFFFSKGKAKEKESQKAEIENPVYV
jgi:hypothetical protein